MKKGTRILLIEERKRYQWSQQKVADLIGTTRHNISRWEQGMTTPSAYFRAKICELFGKQPQELGLLLDRGSNTHGPTPAPNMSALKQRFPLWYVPYPRNPFFTGRETILHHLYRVLHHEHTEVLSQSCVLSGLGGIGKTQTAIEYAYRYASDYAAIFWISAETSEGILSSFVNIAELLNLPEKEEREQSRVVTAVTRWFNNHDQWLLIFDNIEEIKLVQGFLPTARGGSLLLTSRSKALGISTQTLNLEKMTIEEGVHFLLHRTQLLDLATSLAQVTPVDKATAQEIVATMDGLPLALDQAGAYIETTQCSLADYLHLLQTFPLRLLAEREPYAAHPLSVAKTFMLVFERIEQSNALAAEVLTVCAFLAPEAIPDSFFLEGASHLGAAFEVLNADPFQFHNAIKALLAHSLLQRNTASHTLTIHRLVQAVLKERLSEVAQSMWSTRVISTMSRLFPSNKTQVDYWKVCKKLLSHALMCVALSEQENTNVAERIVVMCSVANYLLNCAQFIEAEQMCQRALYSGEHMLGAEHPLVAEALKVLASISFQQGKYEETKLLCHRALCIEEQVLGSEHPQVAGSLNNLAILYAEQGEYEKAEPLFRRALHIWEYALGSEHPRVTTSLYNLGAFYLEQGEYEEAELLLQRALHLEEQSLGPEDPDIAFPLTSLGNLYGEQGKYAQAESFYQRALHIREQTLGQKHPLVAEPLQGLAQILAEQGKYEHAHSLYQRALVLRQQHLGPQHPHVAESLHHMAHFYQIQQQTAEALSLYRQALALREQTLGANHPKTVQTRTIYMQLLQTKAPDD